MEFSFDQIADALYIYISKSKVVETDQISENVMIDYDDNNQICGIEIINFSKVNLDLNRLVKLSSDELIAIVAP
jgi:uncharacterized protein YuzE